MTRPAHAHPFTTDAERFAAVQRRDPAADGAFFYSVATTGVYCKPSCPSRPALRANLAFHGTQADAKAAGFRACKRCRPDVAPQAARDASLVARACRLIETAEEAPKLDALAQAIGLSAFHFHRLFRAVMGVTPKAYADAHRAKRVAHELGRGETVTAALYGAGYGSSGRFYATATARLGMTPGAWIDGGAGTTIRFAVGACSLGAILVAATDKGVCAIQFGDDPQPLLEGLQDRFPKANLIGADAAFEALVARIVAQVETPRRDFTLPLDVAGTAFQERVWRALAAIPLGTTASYAEIAESIGAPKAVRAVAGACAANTAAVAIPCHRVVRTDGSLSGYRWGVDRKRILLEREAKA